MKTPHKHAELIKAWADGADIEHFSVPAQIWMYTASPAWNPENQYRISPEPKPDVVFYARILLPYFDALPYVNGIGQHQGCLDNSMFIFDGSTGKLKSAEVL
jgi:hypothetical protein